jgi:hypothetical protein
MMNRSTRFFKRQEPIRYQYGGSGGWYLYDGDGTFEGYMDKVEGQKVLDAIVANIARRD